MNVLLARGDGIGDALVCAPLVAALRDAGHRVGVLLATANRDAFAAGAFERVHVLERIPWPRHGSPPRSRRRALAEVRAERYDAALIASEEMEMYAFVRAAAVAHRIGFINGWQKPLKSVQVRLLLTRAVVRPAAAGDAREHEAVTLFRLGRGLHAESEPTRDVARLRPLVLDGPVSRHGCVALQVSNKFVASGLDEAAYVEIARALRERGFVALVLGNDAALVRRVASAAGMPAATGLGTKAWKARLAGASVVVTPDCGAAHVAGLVGVPCVDLFAANSATALDIARWRPWAGLARARVLDRTLPARSLAAEIADDALALALRTQSALP